ncbi:MAG: hypothetical protein GKS01_10520 [Alphaproteobacteria bacterium]|nr:hypothetical protein [Alphaproteobacteria bacterium]
MKKLTNVIVALALGFVLLPVVSAQAQMGYHQARHVNGNHLDDAQIRQLDRTLGYKVPSGFYWMDGKKGIWGYEGNKEVLGSIFKSNDPRRKAVKRQQQRRQQQGNSRSQRPYISNNTGTGSAVINPKKGGCSYVSVGGTTMRVCD